MSFTEDALAWIWRRRKLRDAYKKFFTSPEGKLVYESLRIKGGYDHPIIETTDTHLTAFRLGARSMVLHILKTANLTDEQIRDAAENIAQRSGIE